jgi:uncharacterized damage-inducible protein DinB
MYAEQFRWQAKYNAFMNRKLYARAAELSDGERRIERGIQWRTLHATLNYMLLVDKAWMMRFTGDEQRHAFRNDQREPVKIRSLDQELHADFDVLRRERERLDEAIELWALGLDVESLTRELRWFSLSRKREYTQPLWSAIVHFFNHQTHHRGQLLSVLSQLGKDVGVSDLGVFIAEGGNVQE